MAIQQLQLADFRSVFVGNIHNYGAHAYALSKDGGKESGKSWTVTNKLLTNEQYRAHLIGTIGLGIIPIGDDNKCQFGVIDIDIYDKGVIDAYINAIERNNFPLVPFRSKSGGTHLYLFLKTAVPAKRVIDMLNSFVMLLNLDNLVKRVLNRTIEIFPKQQHVQEKSIGNWINLPYFNAENTTQYAVRGGKPLDLNDALAYIKEQRRTLAELQSFIDNFPNGDGPPCLQSILILNILGPNSGRNNFLFSLGVYLKKKDESFWEQKLFETNASLQDPIPKSELESTIVSSLRKKDFSYKCSEAPCVDYCRKPICKTREFGIGKEGGYFSELDFGKLYQILTSDPYYEWEVRTQGSEEFRILRFKNEMEIIGQDQFLRLCFRDLHTLPIKMKQSEWFKLINQSLGDMEIKSINKEDDTSPFSLFTSLFVDFLTNRAMASTRDQLFSKRVYYDKDKKVYYFRANDLNDFLFVGKNFRYYGPSELHGLLRDVKAVPTRLKTESEKQIRVYLISRKDVENIGEISHEVFKAELTKESEDM